MKSENQLIENNERTKKQFALLGFRSRKGWKCVLSVLYLIFCGIVLLGTLLKGRVGQITVYDYWMDKLYGIIIFLLLISPYLFLSNSNFRDKLPLFKKHKTAASAAGMAIVLTVLLIVSGVVNSLHSAEYRADMAQHAYTETVQQEATCEEEGEVSLYCEYCGKKGTEKIAALGHEMQTVADGARKCSRCGVEEKEENAASAVETETIDTAAATVQATEKEPAETESTTEAFAEEVVLPDCAYAKLSDAQFKLLTEMLAKSFYSFNLSNADYAKLEHETAVMDCLTQIYDYAYANCFDLDPDYAAVFATKYEVISTMTDYDLLEKNFVVEHYLDNEADRWIYSIRSYSLDHDALTECGDKLYLDAEGYLNKDVVVYWLEDGAMTAVGQIEDIAYNAEIDGAYYAYALNATFYDDPYSSGWRDGESFLRTNKLLTGKPLYYVDVQDINRNIMKEEIDYSGNIVWKPLNSIRLESGTEVYFGAGSAKSFMFTILEADPESNLMLVEYPSGSVEYKLYSSIMENEYLYVK